MSRRRRSSSSCAAAGAASSGRTPEEAAPSEKSAGAELLEGGSFLTTANLRRLWSLTEWRGFRVFLVRLPQDGTDEPLQLQFRLAGLTWRLSGLELPQELRDRLVRELAARQSAGR
jgi:hypothetical protein